jgi:Zn-dependent alcohol dehydrogenase
MRMTAAVLYELGLPAPYVVSQPFRIEEVDLDGPGEGEVLVEVKAAGICHSDLTVVAGQRKRAVPVVGGHEGAGIVREIGRGVRGLQAGDHVVMTAASGCGYCRTCAEQKPVLCDNATIGRAQGILLNGARRLSLNGDPISHYSGISSFAQYAVTTPQTLVKIDQSIPLDVAAIFGCAVLTGVGCVFNAAKVRPGQNVAVLGLGGVGLNAVMAARICGASKIIGIDINESKFPLAMELGCTNTFLATKHDLVTQVRDLTAGGVDFAFEMSGARAAMANAIGIARNGGEVICVGLGATSDVYEYPHTLLVAQEKVIRGSLLGSGVAARDIPLYLRLYSEGKLPVGRLTSRGKGLADLNLNLDLLDRGEVLRQVLMPNG